MLYYVRSRLRRTLSTLTFLTSGTLVCSFGLWSMVGLNPWFSRGGHEQRQATVKNGPTENIHKTPDLSSGTLAYFSGWFETFFVLLIEKTTTSRPTFPLAYVIIFKGGFQVLCAPNFYVGKLRVWPRIFALRLHGTLLICSVKSVPAA